MKIYNRGKEGEFHLSMFDCSDQGFPQIASDSEFREYYCNPRGRGEHKGI